MGTGHLYKKESGQSQVNLATGHDVEIVPTPQDLNVTRLVVAVHGIGSQFRYATVQAVARRFAAYCRRPITQPLGAFHPEKLIMEPDSPELGAYLKYRILDPERDHFCFSFNWLGLCRPK